MKKIFYIAIFVLLSFVMISCKKDQKFSLNINADKCVGLRNSVVINYTIVDPDQELKNSNIRAEIKKVGSEVNFSSRDISYDVTKLVNQEVKFLSLESGVTYTVKFVAGVDGKQVTLATYDVTTTTEGNTADSPYIIKTAEDFKTLMKNDLTGHYKLGNDIDFAGASIDPLFTNTTQFTGTFDGATHTISNFKVGTAETLSTINFKYYGFFGYIGAKGVIKNVNFDNFEINAKRTSTTTFVGVVAGYNAGTIDNVTISNSNIRIDIENSSSPNSKDSSGNLTGYYVAGIAGQNKNGASILNCNLNKVNINVKARRGVVVGGICAINYDNSNVEKENKIENCKFDGSINVEVSNTSATSYESITTVGGIIGSNYNVVSNCMVAGSIELKSEFKTPSKTKYRVFCGGLVGWNASDIAVVKDSKVEANIAFESKDALEVAVGLLVGQNGGTSSKNYSTVSNCSYKLPAEGTCVVTAYEGRYNVGLIGLDKNPTEGNTTTELNITVNVYHTVKETDPETQKEAEKVVLKETTTVNVK